MEGHRDTLEGKEGPIAVYCVERRHIGILEGTVGTYYSSTLEGTGAHLCIEGEIGAQWCTGGHVRGHRST